MFSRLIIFTLNIQNDCISVFNCIRLALFFRAKVHIWKKHRPTCPLTPNTFLML